MSTKDLKAKIQSGEEIILEFEYDFERINREYYSTPNKNTIIYEAQVVPILNKNGTIVGHILLTNDVPPPKKRSTVPRRAKRTWKWP